MRAQFWLLLGILAMGVPASGNQRVQGDCSLPGQQVNVPSAGGQSTTNAGLATYWTEIFTSCTITVYITGSGGTLATLYSDNSNTPLANPFTSDSTGHWYFYAAAGRYDIQRSGGSAPGFPSPSTYGDFLVFDPSQLITSLQILTSSSTTLTLNAQLYSMFNVTLASNLTTLNIINASVGQILNIDFCENATGGYTVAWPASFQSPPFVNGTPNACTYATFRYDGTKWTPLNAAPTYLNQTIMVDEMPGLDLGAKLNACIALLPATGGLCDASNMTGTWNLSTAVNITLSNVTVVLNPGLTVNQSAALAVTGSSSSTPLMNFRLEGRGAIMKLVASSAFTQPANSATDGTFGLFMIQLTNVQNSTIRNLTLDGNRASQLTTECYNGLGLYGSSDVHIIDDVILKNIQRHAVLITSNGQTSPASGLSQNDWVQGDNFTNDGLVTNGQCTLGFTDSGGVALQNSSTTPLPAGYYIRGNHFDTVATSLDLAPQGTSGNQSVSSVFFDSNTITNPQMGGVNSAAVMIETPGGTPAGSQGHQYVHITNNNINGSTLGIYYSWGQHFNISGNHLVGGVGIGVGSSGNSSGGIGYGVVSDNVVDLGSGSTCSINSAYSGRTSFEIAQHGAAINNLQVHGNISTGCAYGISVGADSINSVSHVNVYGNDGSGSTTMPLSSPVPYPAGVNSNWFSDDSGSGHVTIGGVLSESVQNDLTVGGNFTLNLASAAYQLFTLSANAALTSVTAPAPGTFVTFQVKDNGACGGSSCTFAMPAAFHPAWVQVLNKTCIELFKYDGTNYWGLGLSCN